MPSIFKFLPLSQWCLHRCFSFPAFPIQLKITGVQSLGPFPQKGSPVLLLHNIDLIEGNVSMQIHEDSSNGGHEETPLCTCSKSVPLVVPHPQSILPGDTWESSILGSLKEHRSLGSCGWTSVSQILCDKLSFSHIIGHTQGDIQRKCKRCFPSTNSHWFQHHWWVLTASVLTCHVLKEWTFMFAGVKH